MKTTMTPSSRCLNVNCEMVEAFEAVLPKSILAKLEPFSFAICCKDGGYVICLQSFKALSDDVYHGPLTKYIDKNNWFGFVDDVKSKPEYKARLAELHVPAAIAPEIELLELHKQWNDHNKYVIDKFIINFKPGNPMPLGAGRKGSFFTKKMKNLLFFYSLLKNPAY